MVGASIRIGVVFLVVLGTAIGSLPAAAEDWPQWRGPGQDGIARETGLIESWSRDGENLIWRHDFIGRSTPVVLGGRVFVQGRAGEGKLQREIVSAFDAGTGGLLWERSISTALTTVPFNRAGWSALAADRETGYVYAQGIAGPLVAYDRDGNVVWEHSLAEEFGRYSGYGGRTQTPLVDEGLLIVNVINSTWGELGPPRHRYYGFDKRTGAVVWTSTPGGEVADLNTASNGTVAVIGGRRLYISGNGDGFLYALEARTGRMVWKFELSKRAINSSPVVDGTVVYAGHSEENVDEGTLGRLVAIDATGTGDVTKSHELWRRRDIGNGFPTPLVHDGTVYVMDNSANLFALDAKTGASRWTYSLGTVGKSAPVFGDGKIYATEVNGWFHILRPHPDRVEALDKDQLTMPDGRYAELYSSPAVAYGRIYFTTEEGIYCLGNKSRPFADTASAERQMPAETRGSDDPVGLLVVPGDSTVSLGDKITFEVRAYNEVGRILGPVAATLRLDGLAGEVGAGGVVTLPQAGAAQAGHVVATLGALEAKARVRVFPPLPMIEDFETVQGRGRRYWIGAGRFQVVEKDGGKVLEKPVAESGLLRSMALIGSDRWSNYTIEADVLGNQAGRRRSDVGVINGGYILDLLGNGQKLQIRSWSAVLRMAETIPFEWEMGVWYKMKLRVETQDGQAVVRGKVWKRDLPEPAEWTITADDPLPVPSGSPGLIGYSPAPTYWDNVKVTVN